MPGATVNAVKPAGRVVKMRLSTLSAASRVVATVRAVTAVELKFSVSVIDGTAVAGVVPARSSDQVAALFQEAPVAPLK